MEHIKCVGQLTGKDGGELRGIKLLGIPHKGDLLTHQEDGRDENYEIVGIEHLSGDSADFPRVRLKLRPLA